MSKVEALFLCNKDKFCAKDGGCGEDMCNHTFDIHFAANDDAIKAYYDFVHLFDLRPGEDGTIYAVEKEK